MFKFILNARKMFLVMNTFTRTIYHMNHRHYLLSFQLNVVFLRPSEENLAFELKFV